MVKIPRYHQEAAIGMEEEKRRMTEDRRKWQRAIQQAKDMAC